MEATRDRASWLKGGTAQCNIPAEERERPWRLVLLGAPGVGKGTQAELISERLGCCHLSTGDVFRAAKTLNEEERSPALNEALDCMRKGELVSDETVLSMVKERTKCLRCGGGFLLDGFPRTVAQAEALDALLEAEGIPLDAVLSYELPIEQIVTRLSGRRTCAQCKAVYHVVGRPPKVEGVCDQCGGELIQREDDRPESVKVRMETYERSTKPLIDYFNRKALLVPVSADGTVEEIFERTEEALAGRHTG
jgi:adenylate kinase